MATPEAFLLLTLPNATLLVNGTNQSGILNLECVTLPIPNASDPVQRDVYLVLRLGSFEIPIDPARPIQKADGPGYKSYTFQTGEASVSSELAVSVNLPLNDRDPNILEDLWTFESILAQYTDLKGDSAPTDIKGPLQTSKSPEVYGDLRGRLVLINQDNGEVVGQIDDSRFKVEEDPVMYERGHENDAVIIEVPQEKQAGEEPASTTIDIFVRAIPPEQQDWITKSATIVSHAISTTTNLLLTTITAASNYYISHSTPHSTASSPTPPRALVFLTSERTRKSLRTVHAVSGQAVMISSKTVSTIDDMMRRTLGGKPKKERQFLPKPTLSSAATLRPEFSQGNSAGKITPPLPPRSRSPSPSIFSSTPVYPGRPLTHTGKPALPPRPSRSPSPAPPLPLLITPLSRKERVLLSADLILSTVNQEAHRILDVGANTVGNMADHKYGHEAGEALRLIAGTARNVGMVYVDMRGMGRRALLKKAGKQVVEARLSQM